MVGIGLTYNITFDKAYRVAHLLDSSLECILFPSCQGHFIDKPFLR